MGLAPLLTLLTSDSNTNIFKAPEAVKETPPEVSTFEDIPAEPEMPPIQGTRSPPNRQERRNHLPSTPKTVLPNTLPNIYM